MNLLTITLCVLLEVLIAKTQRLPADSFNTNKLVAYGAPSATLLPDVISNYPQPNSKPLYNYSYNTDTGIRVQEDGHINHINTEQEALEARAKRCSLPEIPPLIKKALQYIAEHPEENAEKH
ncbi:uncharacterized protein LOC114932941 isoform X2 [Nylanderia fulva]|uniref:uncharacterized protein LOC114932941 isoform X2 n=1 Tax=Nylanderia fulva TaxID=613905 RepID=UPI0010FB8D6C|nr:uncharacterized protein LOC114932941 isoform X2 [Nylanderia fulva]